MRISKKMWTSILERDRFTCQMCGAVAGEAHHYDPSRKAILQIVHLVQKSIGGKDEAGNLRAVCSICYEGARKLAVDRPSLQELLIQVRRATGEDQKRLLEWLVRKFRP